MEQISQDQQPQPQIRSTPYAAPMFNYGGSIILLTNPSDELHKMELTLRSVMSDSEGTLRSVGDPLMNELGITAVIGSVRCIVSQVTVMSNLDKDEISALRDYLADVIIRDLMISRLRYEIKTANDRSRIAFIVISSAFICMKRAYEEGEKRFWKGSQQEITTRVEGVPRGKSMFSKVMGWGK